MYGTKIKNYTNDLKGILFLLAIIFIAVILNWNYFFSDDTLNEVKVVEKKELLKPVDGLVEKK